MSMTWERLLNPERLGRRPRKDEAGRSPFLSDYDKIVFSGAFRRLAKKTQVHPLASNDHIHNRLTHSLEVACVGRSLGFKVGEILSERQLLPCNISPNDIASIVQSTCMAHDIGNPPFGHTGEEAFKSWFDSRGSDYLNNLTPQEKHDLCNFEGNAQGLRVLTTVENHLNEGGLRLTYATLGAFIKYPWTSIGSTPGANIKKYGVMSSELEIFHEIADAVGLIKKEDNKYCRHPLVHLMEAADDFCYAIIDLEDALEMGILTWQEVYDIIYPVLPKDALKTIDADLEKVNESRKIPLIRGAVIGKYVEAAADAFIDNLDNYMNGDDTSLIKYCSPEVRTSIEKSKEIATSKIFNHRRKIELEIGSYNVIATLLEVMCSSAIDWARHGDKMSYRSKRVMELIGTNTFDPKIKPGKVDNCEYLVLRRVIDFISGMTDNYATFLAKQFSGMGI